MEIKNKLTVMRVEGGGNNRGGVKSRKCIKDPRTKIQGVGRAGENNGGGNGDNYN